MAGDSANLRSLLVHTRDGEWGSPSPGEGLVPVRVIRGTDFEAVRQGDLTRVPTRYLRVEYSTRKALRSGDILIETAGGSKGRPTGRTLLIQARTLERENIPFTCASFARFLRVDDAQVYAPYLYWFLQYLYQIGEMELHQVQHTGIARFQFTRFAEEVEVPLPPPRRQRTIAHILGTLDDKIELNRQMNETLEAMAQALFKSWFVDFDPVRAKIEGRDTGLPPEIAGLFPDRLVDSEMGEIPEGWTVGSLGDIATSLRRGIDPARVASDTPYIGLQHMPRRSVAMTDWGGAGSVSSRKSAFEVGDILFGKLRPYFHKVGIAPVDGLCSTDIVVLKARIPRWSAFVLACVSSSAFVAHTSQTSTGTKMPRTSWPAMSTYELCRPTDAIASEFQHVVSRMLGRIVGNVHESRTLAALRDTLLPKLISGAIRVPDAEKLVGASP